MVLAKLRELLGLIPEDTSEFRHRMRIHQGWWRLAVLGEEAGEHPNNPSKVVCNTINNGSTSLLNFISENSINAYQHTLEERKLHPAGLFEEKRLLNNLLSSQPLCFNFFGELKEDLEFAASILRIWIPSVRKVDWVKFEYAPEKNYSHDYSAFDVAMRYTISNDKLGLFGLECKYTDDFSPKGKSRIEYKNIYEKNSDIFIKGYESYLQPRYVQLFRNQLIAQSLINYDEYNEVYTGLFCHHDDHAALGIGREFQDMLSNGSSNFKIITYKDFISEIQKLDLTWKQREWTMLLWARYCGLELSEKLFNQIH